MPVYTVEQVKEMSTLPEGWKICLECNEYFYSNPENPSNPHFHILEATVDTEGK